MPQTPHWVSKFTVKPPTKGQPPFRFLPAKDMLLELELKLELRTDNEHRHHCVSNSHICPNKGTASLLDTSQQRTEKEPHKGFLLGTQALNLHIFSVKPRTKGQPPNKEDSWIPSHVYNLYNLKDKPISMPVAFLKFSAQRPHILDWLHYDWQETL